ncbi:hypothetical protein L7F22_010866 [Adiantum nelumboides]|nr:hypothetical protein [Adiantum nelumboides]
MAPGAHADGTLAVVVMMVVVSWLCVGLSDAASYKVGDDAGWSLDTDLQGWVDGQDFRPGDVLEFNYNPDEHNVLEVMEGQFEQCSTTNPIAHLSSGADRITLDKSGTRFFLCGIVGHCPGGMKIRINVVA